MSDITSILKSTSLGTAELARQGNFRDAALFAARDLMANIAKMTIGDLYPGTNIYDKEWDVLLVLDAYRVDLLSEVAQTCDYEFLPNPIPHMVSVGGTSGQWMDQTFTPKHYEEIGQTTYISANPHTRRVIGDMEIFKDVVPVWEEGWDHELGTVPARAVTDRLIQYCRENEADRVIAHYMQPHFPSVPDGLGSKMDFRNDAVWVNSVWDRLSARELSFDEVWSAYISNLRYVLDEVVVVLDNVEAETVAITADHGNASGEWGCYGHGDYAVDTVRYVPWVTTTAHDTSEYTPSQPGTETEKGKVSIDQQLEALGYKT